MVPINGCKCENGCLQVVPGSHRGDILTHCPQESGTQIPEKLIQMKLSLFQLKKVMPYFLPKQQCIHHYPILGIEFAGV